VAVKIVATGVGGITEGDVLLAQASHAIIIGFNVRPDSKARKLAEREKIEIKTYSIIYDLIDDIKKALEGLLSPDFEEEYHGRAEVRQLFNVPKVGVVAGCYVVDGKITRNSKIRLLRDNVIVFEGELASLKRFKDDAKEVQAGYECGMGIANFNDLKIGDIIEAYDIIEKARTL
jgi:translation initiation factor IF-2